MRRAAAELREADDEVGIVLRDVLFDPFAQRARFDRKNADGTKTPGDQTTFQAASDHLARIDLLAAERLEAGYKDVLCHLL